jgi:hypothetical protein
MSKASKFAGMGRAGNTLGKVSAKSRAPYTPSGRGASGPSAKVGSSAKLGSPAVTQQGQSTHNSIGTFLRGAKSRGPYGGPSFASLNNMEKNYKRSTPSSACASPSGGGKTMGGPRTAKRGVSDYNNPMKESMQSPSSRRPMER